MFSPMDEFDPSPDEDEKTGPARFFQLLQAECASLLKLNLLFLVSCLPVVTIPLAVFALSEAVWGMVLERPDRRPGGYWSAFRQGGKRAYGAFFLTALPLGLAGWGAFFYLREAAKAPLLLLPFAFCTTVLFTVLLSSPYLYGLLYLGKSLKEAARPALILGLGRPLRALLGALCCCGLPLAAILLLPLSGAYLVLIGFSVPCLLGCFLLRTVLGAVHGQSPS